MHKQRARAAAAQLLEIGAVVLRPNEPFTWASGIKSPIYCDNRLVLGYPKARAVIEAGLSDMIKEAYPTAQVLMGTATAGIAHAALVADRLAYPMGYVRGAKKEHGKGNRIEGRLNPGDRVVVVEDLISTGGSCIEAVRALREADAEVLGVAAIFTYNIGRGFENFAAENTSYRALCDIETLLGVAVEGGYIKADRAKEVIAFRDSL
ncbi:MAG: orotate phosphoribosyltransferase [Clostridiales bacterium]|jgi:orotate phosphoribosyltransferase|nr:orotate phosphoribosyltransferase [Clostridiales bacterium]